MLEKTEKCSKPARKIWAQNENPALSSNCYWRGLFQVPCTEGQGSQHRTAVLINTRYRCVSTGSSQPKIQLSQPSLCLKTMLLSCPFLLVSCF